MGLIFGGNVIGLNFNGASATRALLGGVEVWSASSPEESDSVYATGVYEVGVYEGGVGGLVTEQGLYGPGIYY